MVARDPTSRSSSSALAPVAFARVFRDALAREAHDDEDFGPRPGWTLAATSANSERGGTVIRAFATLVGLACAAAILLLPAVGWIDGGDLWKRAAILAAAGLVAGVFYQLGGIRRPGVRLNLPMLLAAWLPWSILALAVCADLAGTPSTLARWVRDIVPSGALARWSPSFPILAFTSGLLLAFALIEPLVQQRAEPKATQHVVPVEDTTPSPPQPVAVAQAAE